MSTEGTQPFRILSLDGGGYLGLATAKFIHEIENHFSIRFSEIFDMFCGTSTGAILALGLAHGRTGHQLTELYKQLGNGIFGKKRWTYGFGLRARYCSKPLKAALEKEFCCATLGNLHEKNKSALITAFNLTKGKPRVFKTDHAPHLTLDNQLRLCDVALASSAAPFYFPAVRVHNPKNGVTELFCDGGVVANHPALLGFSEVVSDLKKPPGKVRILSLSTPGEDFGEGTATMHLGDRGIMRWRSKLASMFIESGAGIADEILRRLITALPTEMQPRYERIEMHNRASIAMDCASVKATTELLLEGTTKATDGKIRNRVAHIVF